MTATGRRSIIAGCAAALAGCGLLPEGPEPIEAEAVSPADLPASSDYSTVVSETRTFETTITVDLSGDVELTSRRDVTATVFRRVYEDDAGRRLGLVTAPAVVVVESPETVRDPVASLDAARVVALATDRSVDSVDELERLVDLGHELADEWIDAHEEHYRTDFTFVLVADELPEDVREFVDGQRERTLLKYGYYGHYEVNLGVVVPDAREHAAGEAADVIEAFLLWEDVTTPDEGFLSRLARWFWK